MVTRQSGRGSSRSNAAITVAQFNEKYGFVAYGDSSVQAALDQAAGVVEPYLSLSNDALFQSGTATGYISYPGGVNVGVTEAPAPFAALELVEILARPIGTASDFEIGDGDGVVLTATLSLDGRMMAFSADISGYDLFIVTAVPRTMRITNASVLPSGVLWYVGQPGVYSDGRYWDTDTGVYTFEAGVELLGRSMLVYDPPAELEQKLEFYTGEVARVLLQDPTAMSESVGPGTASGPIRSEALRAVLGELVSSVGPSFGSDAASRSPASTGTIAVAGGGGGGGGGTGPRGPAGPQGLRGEQGEQGP